MITLSALGKAFLPDHIGTTREIPTSIDSSHKSTGGLYFWYDVRFSCYFPELELDIITARKNIYTNHFGSEDLYARRT